MELTKKLRLWIVALAALLLANVCFAQGWTPIRTSGPGTKGWQSLVCDNGNGWRSCEMPVNIVLTANPTSLVAIGEQATITATVTDYYGVAIAGAVLNWSSTDGTISAAQNITDANGISSIVLTSSHTLGGSTVTAETAEKDGIGSIWIPYIDKWVATSSTYTGYSNYGAPYSCSAWSPATSTVAAGTGFWQTANCWQAQIRYRQDREVSVVTGSIRNVAAPVAEYQYIVITQSQFAIGTKIAAPVCSFNPSRSSSGTILTTTPTQWGTFDPNGDISLSDNGSTGFTIAGSGYHGAQRWPGSVDYNGYRYTVGAFRFMYNQGRNFETYLFEVCKTPL